MPDDIKLAGLHHNRPPIADWYKEQNETLPDYLAEDNADIVTRTAALCEAFARAPAEVADEETAGTVSDFIAQITKCAKTAEAKRVDVKAGPLAAGRLIDGFFQKQILDRLDGIKKPLLSRLTAFERAKAEAERRAREEAERQAREAAAAAARAAAEAEQKIRDAKSLEEAIAAEAAAKQQEADALAASKAAVVKAAELSTVRGDFGSSSSLRTVWKARAADWMRVDLNALRSFIGKDVVEKAANAHARTHKNAVPVVGLEFFEDTQAVVRG